MVERKENTVLRYWAKEAVRVVKRTEGERLEYAVQLHQLHYHHDQWATFNGGRFLSLDAAVAKAREIIGTAEEVVWP